MKKIAMVISLILLLSCNKKNYSNQNLNYELKTENGGKYFLNLNIDSNSNVQGKNGYSCCETFDADSWDGIIVGKIKNNEIDGVYVYEAEGIKYNKTVNIKIFENYAILNETGEKELKLELIKNDNDEAFQTPNELKWNEINKIKGKVILQDLIHPVTEEILKNCLVLKLEKNTKFIGDVDSDGDIYADVIRIYGDVQNPILPEKKYAELINKNVVIEAKLTYSPSGNYPLSANIVDDFKFKILE